MVTFCAKADAFFTSLCSLLFLTAAQYENYNFINFPEEELVPLTTAYKLALDHYAAERWTDAIIHLERSLRLHRLLKDSARYCALHCNGSGHEEPTPSEGNRNHGVYWHVTVGASCQKKCRAHFPALQLPPPCRQTLEDFSRRSPYKYLHFAYSRLNDLQRAVPCAYTYLQKNPGDQEVHHVMEEYKSQYDLRGYLTDHEERPHEAPFLRGVKLISSGDYSGGVELMEEALRLYLHEYDLCQADCEGISQLPPNADFYTVIADIYIEILKCKLRCEETLRPNVGGYFVERLVATIYHHLQYGYYKLNEGRSAVLCAYSYFLFEPEDHVMTQNLLYYKAYTEQWGLQPNHFTPRMEALKHFNQTAAQKRLLTFVEEYIKLNDEDFLGLEEAARLASESPDVEFEGMGDYEESIYADWRQPKGKGDSGESNM